MEPEPARGPVLSTVRPFPTPKREAADWPPLPQPRSSFVGREREIATVRELLLRDDVPLVTLRGPGGIGKTRLALHVASAVASNFADGVLFVALADVRSPAHVIPRIAEAARLRNPGTRGIAETVRSFLRTRELLLVLDNFEHLISAASLIEDLLIDCSRMKVLVTSREALRISGEHQAPVGPLALPSSSRSLPADGFLDYAAVHLFTDRARAVRPDLDLTPDAIHTAVEICRRLDGIPLAIELAAAHVAHLPLRALATRLDHRLPILRDGPRDAPGRLRTMSNAISWSVDLLSGEERRHFQRLSVFVGGFTLDAMNAVATSSGDDAGDAFRLVTSLVDKSLVELDATGNEPRYWMLETIREHAANLLTADGEATEIQGRHSCFFLALVESDSAAVRERGDSVALGRIAEEQANLRAALEMSLARGDLEAGARLFTGLWHLWRERGQIADATAIAARLLPLRSEMPGEARLRLLITAGDVVTLSGDDALAHTLLDEALSLARTLSSDSLAWALFYHARAAYYRGDDSTAEASFREALLLARARGATSFVASILDTLGSISVRQGNFRRAFGLFDEASTIARTTGNEWLRVGTICQLGGATFDLGQTRTALGLFRESLDILHEAGERVDPRMVAGVLVAVARVAGSLGHCEEAARLRGAVDCVIDDHGLRLSPVSQLNAERADRVIGASLTATEIAGCHLAGRGMATEMAIEEAIALTSSLSEQNPPHGVSPDDVSPAVLKPRLRPPVELEHRDRLPVDVPQFGLTRREREVLTLLGQGFSDREIAATLYVSPQTVATHVKHILGKLDVSSRAAAVAVAYRSSLLDRS